VARFESSIAANDMFPKLSIILTAVIAACVAVVSASVGLVGTGNSVKHAAAVPDIGHLLMQQAIMDAPEWQHFQSLAYARRADELLRLRDLPAAPARAVVEFAEQPQIDATLSAPPFATEPPDDVATKTTLQTDQAQSAAAPVSLAGPITAEPSMGSDTPVATIVASLQDGAGEITGGIAPPKLSRVAMPRPNPKARAEARRKKLAAAVAGVHKQVANLDAGATVAGTAAEKPSVGSSRRGTKVAEPPRKKRHASRAPRQVAPEASTGFPIDVQQTNGQSTSANTRFGAGFEGRQ
jgi:hypothetical protein